MATTRDDIEIRIIGAAKAEVELRRVSDAEEKVGKAAQAVDAHVSAAEKAFSRLASQGTRVSDALGRGGGSAYQNVGLLSKALGELKERAAAAGEALGIGRFGGQAALVGGIGVLAVQAGKAGFELAQAGARTKDVETAFRNLGGTSEQFNQAIRNLGGAVSDNFLRQQFNLAKTLGISSDQFSQLTRVAKAASVALGKSVPEALEDITIAVARQSKLVLDNLGLIVDIEDANKKYAASIGKTASKLTEAEKQQAFFNATMEAAKPLLEKIPLDAHADKYARLTAAIKNYTDALASYLDTALGVFTSTVEMIDRVARRADEGARLLGDTFRSLRDTLGLRRERGGIFGAFFDQVGKDAIAAIPRLKAVREEFQRIGSAAGIAVAKGIFDSRTQAGLRALSGVSPIFGAFVPTGRQEAERRAARGAGRRPETAADIAGASLRPSLASIVGDPGRSEFVGPTDADAARLEQERFRLQAQAANARLDAARKRRESDREAGASLFGQAGVFGALAADGPDQLKGLDDAMIKSVDLSTQLAGSVNGLFQGLASGIGQSISQAILASEGLEQTVNKVVGTMIAGVGQMAITQGTYLLLISPFASFLLPGGVAAGAAAASGAALVAFGLATTAAAKVLGAGGGGGGGGGRSGASGASATSRPGGSGPPTRGRSEAGGPQQVVFNVNFVGQPLATERDVGEMVRRALQMTANVRGVTPLPAR